MTAPALQRILRLADPGSYAPWRPMNNAGYHLGDITVDGRAAHVLATDPDHPVKGSLYAGLERVVGFLEYIADNPAPRSITWDATASRYNYIKDASSTPTLR